MHSCIRINWNWMGKPLSMKLVSSHSRRRHGWKTRTERRLDKKYEILTKQYVELDTYLSEMSSMSDYLTQTFAAITGSSD